MAVGTVGTAAGAALFLYYILTRRTRGDPSLIVEGAGAGKRRMGRRPSQAPATWLETLTTLSETLRFIYGETLGKWPITDLAFGINYLMRRQGNLDVGSIYGGNGCLRLKGDDVVVELKILLRLLTLGIYFSKRPFPVFLESAGFSDQDVLFHRPKAGILKPAFTVIRDRDSKVFLLLIRGTHSMKDTLTAATGAGVPFHHSVLNDGVINLVLGYAHCGMVAAARWIAKLSTPCLLKALAEFPDHSIKVVGHSLGGGTAALLTYILREQKEFASSVCVAFAPAACMTWDLAESGKHFITTLINGSDMVPTFSSASADDLRSEVTASSWLNDLRDKLEQTRVLNVVYRSATALGSHLPSVASARAKVVIKRAQDVAEAVAKTRPVLSSWSCMGPRRRALNLPEMEPARGTQEESIGHGEEEGPLIADDGTLPIVEQETEDDDALWLQLKKEAAASKELITEEESTVTVASQSSVDSPLPIVPENQRFYPPGRLLHIVYLSTRGDDGDQVALFETSRELYSKIRLSRTMIHDHYMPIYKKMMELLIKELGHSY